MGYFAFSKESSKLDWHLKAKNKINFLTGSPNAKTEEETSKRGRKGNRKWSFGKKKQKKKPKRVLLTKGERENKV